VRWQTLIDAAVCVATPTTVRLFDKFNLKPAPDHRVGLFGARVVTPAHSAQHVYIAATLFM
jgi:hypothetical protein